MISPELALAAQRLFTDARTHAQWLPKPVPVALLRELYELAKHGPTSMNCQPMRLLFVQDAAERERLAGCVNAGNVQKVRSAPVVAVVGQEMAFPQTLATLFAHKTDAPAYYEGKPDVIASTALRNSSLQGGLPDFGGTSAGAGLRTALRLSGRRSGRGVLAGHHGAHQLPVLPGLWRCRKAQAAQSTSEL